MARSRSHSTKSGYPLPFRVQVRRRVDSREDSFGNPVTRWGGPQVVRVAGWSIDQSAEHGPDDKDIRRVDWAGALFAIPGDVSAGDVIHLGGVDFVIADGGHDFTHGPWWDPGLAEYKLRILRGLSVADSFKFKMNHQFFNRVLKESSETKHLVDNKAEEFRSKVGEHYVVKEAEPGHRRWRALIVPTPYDWEAYGHEKKHNALQKAVGAYPVASKSPKKGA